MAVGDLVAVESAGKYWLSPKPNSTFRPTEMQFQRIEGFPAPGVVQLRYPLEASGLTVLRRLTNLARAPGWPNLVVGKGVDTGIPLFASFRSGVIGGVWETKRPAAAFVSTGGALECVLSPHEVVAGFGVGYGNLFSRCQMSVDRETISEVPVELAFHSQFNTVHVGTAIASGLRKGAAVPGWFVGIDESSRHNQVTVDRLVLEDSAPDSDHPVNPFASDAVLIAGASCNSVSIGSLTGTAVHGAVAHIASPAYPGERPAAVGNIIDIGQSRLAGQRAYALIDGAGTDLNLIRIQSTAGPTADRQSWAAAPARDAARNAIEISGIDRSEGGWSAAQAASAACATDSSARKGMQ